MDELRSLADLLDLQDVDLQIDRLLNRRHGLPRAMMITKPRMPHCKRSTPNWVRQVGRCARPAWSWTRPKASSQYTKSVRTSKSAVSLQAGSVHERPSTFVRRSRCSAGKGPNSRTQFSCRWRYASSKRPSSPSWRNRRHKRRLKRRQLEALVTAEWKVIDAELARKESRKEGIIPLIPPDLLDLYDELRPTKQGVAVGRLAEGVCGGCHLKLSAAEQVAVQREDPPRCLHCRRILVPQ